MKRLGILAVIVGLAAGVRAEGESSEHFVLFDAEGEALCRLPRGSEPTERYLILMRDVYFVEAVEADLAFGLRICEEDEDDGVFYLTEERLLIGQPFPFSQKAKAKFVEMIRGYAVSAMDLIQEAFEGE